MGYYVENSGKKSKDPLWWYLSCDLQQQMHLSKTLLAHCKLVEIINARAFTFREVESKRYGAKSVVQKRVKVNGEGLQSRRKQLVKVRLYILQPHCSQWASGINSKWSSVRVATYFSSTNCFWYSSYSSRVIPAALAGSEGVASSSLSPPPPRPIPDRGFPIMLLIKKAILSCVTVYSARTRIFFVDEKDASPLMAPSGSASYSCQIQW